MATGAQFSRATVWNAGDILTASAQNGEFDRIHTNLHPAGLGSGLVAAAGMQSVSDPGEVGTEVVPVTLEDRLQQLGKIITEITGKSYPYQSPDTSLAVLAQPAGGLAIGLEFEGALGGASSTTDVLAKFINQGGIINALSLSTANVAAADFVTTKKFGTYGYQVGTGNILAFPGWMCNRAKGSLSAWYQNLNAGDYIAFNRLLGLEMYLDSGAGKQTVKITERTAATESTKSTSTVQGSATRSAVGAFHNITAKWRTNGEAGAATDLLEMEYDGSDEGSQLGSQTFDTLPGMGGNWFFGCRKNDPATWDHFYAANGLPTAHSSAWTSNGTPNGSAVNGVLNIATSATTGFYSKTGAPTLTGVNLAAETIEFKGRLNSTGQRATLVDASCSFNMRDDSLNRGLQLSIFKSSVALSYTSAGTYAPIFEQEIDGTQFHIYRITSNGSPSPTVNFYIDDALVFSGTNATSDTGANDLIQFGTITSSTTDSDWEWIAYADEVAAPIAVDAASTGYLDSIGILNTVLEDTQITALQTAAVTSVFNNVPYYGVTLPANYAIDRQASAGVGPSTTYIAFGSAGRIPKYFVPGDGISECTFSGVLTFNGNSTDVLSCAIDINSDFLGLTTDPISYGVTRLPIVLNANDTLIVKRSVVLPVGLHTIQPVVKEDTGASSFSWFPGHSIFLCSMTEKRKLA